MDFRMLGSLEVSQAGKPVELLGRRQRSLLAALLLRANLASSVTYITDAVWENPPSAPDSNIRTYVTGLRRQLQEPGEPSRGADSVGWLPAGGSRRRTGRCCLRATG